MKVLALYPNTGGYGRIPTGLSIIMTVLDEAGHEVDLFDTTFLEASNRDNDVREEAGFVKPVSLSHMYVGLNQAQIDSLFIEKLNAFSPHILIVSIVEDNYLNAHHFMAMTKKLDPKLPIMIGGSTPSAAPEIMIENPYVDYLVQGEGELASVEVCANLEQGKSIEGIANLWYKVDGKACSNPVRPFIDMDMLPIQKIEWWDQRHFYKPYDGKLHWTGFFEMSRGCPFQCTYCVNSTIQRSLRSAGKFFRRKKPKMAIREIKHHVEAQDLERVVFCDDNFLLMPGKMFDGWGKEFTRLWRNEIGLPYWITTSAEFITPQSARVLKETGCDGVGLGVEAGSQWFRSKILKRHVSNDNLVKCFDILHEFGIRTTANVMIGHPGEHEEDIFETVKLIQRIAPDSYDISLVAPYVGTGIHRVASQFGFIDLKTEPGFRGMATDISFRDYPTIRNPMIPPERLLELHRTFSEYVSGKRSVPSSLDINHEAANDLSVPPKGDLRWKIAEAISGV